MGSYSVSVGKQLCSVYILYVKLFKSAWCGCCARDHKNEYIYIFVHPKFHRVMGECNLHRSFPPKQCKYCSVIVGPVVRSSTNRNTCIMHHACTTVYSHAVYAVITKLHHRSPLKLAVWCVYWLELLIFQINHKWAFSKCSRGHSIK